MGKVERAKSKFQSQERLSTTPRRWGGFPKIKIVERGFFEPTPKLRVFFSKFNPFAYSIATEVQKHKDPNFDGDKERGSKWGSHWGQRESSSGGETSGGSTHRSPATSATRRRGSASPSSPSASTSSARPPTTAWTPPIPIPTTEDRNPSVKFRSWPLNLAILLESRVFTALGGAWFVGFGLRWRIRVLIDKFRVLFWLRDWICDGFSFQQNLCWYMLIYSIWCCLIEFFKNRMLRDSAEYFLQEEFLRNIIRMLIDRGEHSHV